jgi:hypothetical protein
MQNTLSQSEPGRYHVNVSSIDTEGLTNEASFDLGGVYKQFEAGYQLTYSFRDGDWIDTVSKLTYRPGCWSATISLSQTKRPRDTRFNISFDLAGMSGMK